MLIEPKPDYSIASQGATCKVATTKWDKIRTSDNCTSNKTYQHTQCMGYCDSISRATYGDVGYVSTCTCCQPYLTQIENVFLQCPSGESRSTKFAIIKTCRCRQFKCVSEPDKSGMKEVDAQGKVFETNPNNIEKRSL